MNEKLFKELCEECDRLTNIIDSEEVNSDNWKAAYAKKLDILEKMNAFNKVETEYYIKQDDLNFQREREKQMRELEEMKMAQHSAIESQRRIGEIALEKEKKKVNWERTAIEVALVLVPLGITIVERRKELKDIFDFEQHGRITSTVGRQFKILDLFKKR